MSKQTSTFKRTLSILLSLCLLSGILTLSSVLISADTLPPGERVLIDFDTLMGTVSTHQADGNEGNFSSSLTSAVANSGSALQLNFGVETSNNWRDAGISIGNLVERGLSADAAGIKFWARAGAGQTVNLSKCGLAGGTGNVAANLGSVTLTEQGQWIELPFASLAGYDAANIDTYKYLQLRAWLKQNSGVTVYVDDIRMYGLPEESSSTQEPTTAPTTTAPATTDYNVTAALDKASYTAGDTVRVSVAMTGIEANNKPVSGFNFAVQFPSDVLSIANTDSEIDTSAVTLGSGIESGWSASFVTTIAGVVQVLCYDDTNLQNMAITEDGVLFTLEFTLSSAAADGSYPIDLDISNGDFTKEDGVPATVTMTGASVTVSGSATTPETTTAEPETTTDAPTTPPASSTVVDWEALTVGATASNTGGTTGDEALRAMAAPSYNSRVTVVDTDGLNPNVSGSSKALKLENIATYSGNYAAVSIPVAGFEGAQSLQLNLSGSAFTVQLLGKYTDGTAYKLQCYPAAPNGFAMYEVSLGAQMPDLNNGWTKVSLTAEMLAGLEKVMIQINNKEIGATVYIDDVVLTGAQAAATQYLAPGVMQAADVKAAAPNTADGSAQTPSTDGDNPATGLAAPLCAVVMLAGAGAVLAMTKKKR